MKNIYELVIEGKNKLMENPEFVDFELMWDDPYKFINKTIRIGIKLKDIELIVLNIILRLGIWGEKFPDNSGMDWHFNMPSTRSAISEVEKCFRRYGIGA